MKRYVILIILCSAIPLMGEVAMNYEVAVLGGGCFWCVEAVYERIDGVISAESGYAGGEIKNPSYPQVARGVTGHAEVVRITYDPNIIHYGEILEWFWQAHDPTTLNRQGADVGTQYRSVILYLSDEQKEIAQQSISNHQSEFKDPIVTELQALEEFYLAEAYHQNYYDLNKNNGYCQIVISPKLKKLNLTTKP